MVNDPIEDAAQQVEAKEVDVKGAQTELQDIQVQTQESHEAVSNEPQESQETDLASFFRKQLQAQKRPKQDKDEPAKSDKPAKRKQEPQQAKSQPKEPEQRVDVSPVVDEERLVAAAAKAAALAIQQQQQPQPNDQPSAQDAFESQLDPAEQRRLTVLARMEQLFPDKYKGLRQRYIASLKEAAEYAQKWQQENPDSEWNDEDHEDELARIARKHKVDWEDEDYAEAVADIRAEEKIKQSKEELQKTAAQQIEQQRKAAEMTARIAADVDNAAKDVLESLSEDLGIPELALYDEKGKFSQERLQKLSEEDPIAYKVIVHGIATYMVPATQELLAIWRGSTQFDPGNPLHKWLDEFILDKQKQIQALPPSQRVVNGKDFMPLEKYVALPEDQKSRYWTLTEEDAVTLLTHHYATALKKAYNDETEVALKWSEKRGKLKASTQSADQSTQRASASPQATAMPRGAGRSVKAQQAGDDALSRLQRVLMGE